MQNAVASPDHFDPNVYVSVSSVMLLLSYQRCTIHYESSCLSHGSRASEDRRLQTTNGTVSEAGPINGAFGCRTNSKSRLRFFLCKPDEFFPCSGNLFYVTVQQVQMYHVYINVSKQTKTARLCHILLLHRTVFPCSFASICIAVTIKLSASHKPESSKPACVAHRRG